jgi:hypothetical protein
MAFNATGAWIESSAATDNLGAPQLVLFSLGDAILCLVMPRFIIGVRELYDRDLRGHLQGIDTGFGVSSKPISSGNAVVSAIQFADVAPEQEQEQVQVAEGEMEDSEAIQLEMRDGTRQV